MNRFILWILDRMQGLFRLWGVDYQQLRLIVATKLTMDNRRTYTTFRQQKNADENDNRFLVVLGWYSFTSLFVGVVVYFIPSLFWGATLFFGYGMFVLALALISDFSNTLLDTADNQIVLPHPVTGKTLLFARIAHIVSYILLMNLALCLLPSVLFAIKYGWLTGVLCLVFSFQNSLLVVALTNLIYLLILRFGNEEKLRNVINNLQIVTTLFFTLSYQILPRLIDFDDLREEIIAVSWWYYLIPPFWFSGSIESLIHGNSALAFVGFLALMLVMPLLIFWLINRYLAPAFAQKLSSLGVATENQPIEAKSQISSRQTLSEKLSRLVTFSSEEKTGFELTWKLTARDRKFKLRTYPVFGSLLPFLFIIFFKRGKSLAEIFEDLQTDGTYFFLIYMTSIIPVTFLLNLSFSEDFKAAWFYKSSPLQNPGALLTGSLKAVLLKIYLPVYLVVAVFILAIWGVDVWDDLLLGFLNSTLFILFTALLSKHYFPFSAELTQSQQTGSGLRFMLLFAAEAIIGFIHFGASKIDYLVLGIIILVIPLILYAFSRYRKIAWGEMVES
ncbi:MAG: hypothetical protein H7Y04_05730 [Verrucomicrobia bacterium]|nr:hypothetical protein [Cytophagales bacterium]